MKKYPVITLLFLLLSPLAGATQSVVINELVSANSTGLPDAEGEYSDWIELYNKSNQDVSLKNYTLSDDQEQPGKWTFPDVTIRAKGFLVVFASGKDRTSGKELHTNFKLSQGGESILLTDDQGRVLSSIAPIFVPTDQSYACITDGDKLMRITDVPTPRSSNIQAADIFFSHPSGFYPDSFSLTLKPANKNQQIYYTLNGETPTPNSLRYTKPILIAENQQAPLRLSMIPTTPTVGEPQLEQFVWQTPKSVYRGQVVRFAVYENGKIQGNVYSKSYFIGDNITQKYTFPIVSIVTDSLNLFDHEKGIYIPGKTFEREGFDWWPAGNYKKRGEDWERDIHITYFEPNGQLAFETAAGIRMRGHGSTAFPQKSFNVYFRKEYGLNAIEYPVFENSTAKKYKRLTFRNGGNDFLFSHFKDAMLQQLISKLDLEIQDFQPSVVFINGEYWGIHNIREKYDEYYFKYKFGIDENDINILGVCGKIEEGDNTEYLELIDFISNNDLSINENYQYVSNKIDIHNFIDFHIAEIYFANYDWPCNNYKIWKDKNPNSKWRFLIHDLDYSFGFNPSASHTQPSMEHATSTKNEWPHCDCSNILFRRLLQNEGFKKQFTDRFSYCLQNTFESSRVIQLIDTFEALFQPEIEEHMARWNYPPNIQSWQFHIAKLRTFAKERPCYMANNIASFFNLPAFDFACK